MISDKDAMMRSVTGYVERLSSAREACRQAALGLSTPMTEVSSEWHGRAGEAMVSALSELQEEFLRIYRQLEVLEGQMWARANSLYSSWPEEEEVADG